MPSADFISNRLQFFKIRAIYIYCVWRRVITILVNIWESEVKVILSGLFPSVPTCHGDSCHHHLPADSADAAV